MSSVCPGENQELVVWQQCDRVIVYVAAEKRRIWSYVAIWVLMFIYQLPGVVRDLATSHVRAQRAQWDSRGRYANMECSYLRRILCAIELQYSYGQLNGKFLCSSESVFFSIGLQKSYGQLNGKILCSSESIFLYAWTFRK